MSTWKQIKVLIPQIFFCVACFAQKAKIDSLKKALPILKDSAKVDCLNELAGVYTATNYDSAVFYTDLAYKQALQINYTHGIAESFSWKGEAELYIENFPAAEEFSKKSIYWYRQALNKKRLADAYGNLGFAQFAQSYFKEAINNSNTAYQYSKKDDNKTGMFWSLFILGHIYGESGNYEQAFELDTKALDLAIANGNKEYQCYQLRHIAALFQEMGNYKTALDYYHQAYANGIPVQDSFYYITDYAILYTHLQQYDSAMYYYGLADTSDSRALRFYLAGTGEYFLAKGEYKKALTNLLRSLNYNKEKNDRNQVMRILPDISKTYLALEKYDSALIYGKEHLNLAEQTGAKQFIRDGNQILYLIYDAKHQTDSAYNYYRQYIVMKDSILNDQVKAKLIAYAPQQKIELLNKEKEFQQVVRNILVGSIIILLLLAAIIFRNITLKRKNEKLENERIKAELQQQATELEMQALRAQMNPHFIFNSLNSINRFILQNNKAQASEYLTKFSKLVRMILQSSQAALISLESEIEALKLYLEIEALRFNYHFDYKISFPEGLDVEVLKIPPLIIQPYAENAIWHGLMHKEEKGLLDIEISQEDGHLFFKITDDGIGRNKAAELNSKSATKHKSVGLKITADRIAMMQQTNGSESFVVINDLINANGSAAGTKVIIKMPLIYS